MPSTVSMMPFAANKVPFALPKGVSCDASTAGNVFTPRPSMYQPISSYLDSSDLALPALLVYRANAPPLPLAREGLAIPIVPLDPSSKPVSIGPPRNRKEALLSPWAEGYLAAERLEMKSHEANGTWVLKHLVPHSL